MLVAAILIPFCLLSVVFIGWAIRQAFDQFGLIGGSIAGMSIMALSIGLALAHSDRDQGP